MSGGGVTAGIDFGLALVAELGGEELARMLQLTYEYDPLPPFDCGTPEKAGPERVAQARQLLDARMKLAEQQIHRAAAGG